MHTCILFVILAEDKITYEPCNENDETCKNVVKSFRLVPRYARAIDNENGGKYCYIHIRHPCLTCGRNVHRNVHRILTWRRYRKIKMLIFHT